VQGRERFEGFLLFKNMRRGETTAAELAPLMLRLLTTTSKKGRFKRATPLIDEVQNDCLPVTKDQASRLLAELRKSITEITDK
jgi:hypothetical protein